MTGDVTHSGRESVGLTGQFPLPSAHTGSDRRSTTGLTGQLRWSCNTLALAEHFEELAALRMHTVEQQLWSLRKNVESLQPAADSLAAIYSDIGHLATLLGIGEANTPVQQQAESHIAGDVRSNASSKSDLGSLARTVAQGPAPVATSPPAMWSPTVGVVPQRDLPNAKSPTSEKRLVLSPTSVQDVGFSNSSFGRQFSIDSLVPITAALGSQLPLSTHSSAGPVDKISPPMAPLAVSPPLQPQDLSASAGPAAPTSPPGHGSGVLAQSQGPQSQTTDLPPALAASQKPREGVDSSGHDPSRQTTGAAENLAESVRSRPASTMSSPRVAVPALGGGSALTSGMAFTSPSPRSPSESLTPTEEEGDADPAAALEGGIFSPGAPWRRGLQAVLVMIVLGDMADALLAAFGAGWHDRNSNNGSWEQDSLPIVWSVGELLLFGAEMLLNTRTAQLDTLDVVDDNAGVLWDRYRRSWFAFDFFCWLPVDLLAVVLSTSGAVPAADGALWRVARYIKVLRIVRIGTFFPAMSPLSGRSRTMRFGLFTFYFLASLGILGAVWLLAATTEEATGSEDTPPRKQLTYSLYFIITTLISVGYGDLSPVRVGTMWLDIGVQLLGLWLFQIYLCAVSTGFLLDTDPYTQLLKDRRRRLAALLRNNKIPWQLQKQCFSLMPGLLESNAKDYNAVLAELPPFMQDTIQECIKSRIVRRIPLFNGISAKAVAQISNALRREWVPPGYCIIEFGDIGEEMYVIIHGCVEVTRPGGNGDYWLATLKDGAWFGEVALLSQESRRTANVRAVTACDLVVLPKADLLEVVGQSPVVLSMMSSEARRRHVEQHESDHLGRSLTSATAMGMAEDLTTTMVTPLCTRTATGPLDSAGQSPLPISDEQKRRAVFLMPVTERSLE